MLHSFHASERIGRATPRHARGRAAVTASGSVARCSAVPERCIARPRSSVAERMPRGMRAAHPGPRGGPSAPRRRPSCSLLRHTAHATRLLRPHCPRLRPQLRPRAALPSPSDPRPPQQNDRPTPQRPNAPPSQHGRASAPCFASRPLTESRRRSPRRHTPRFICLHFDPSAAAAGASFCVHVVHNKVIDCRAPLITA